MAGETGTWQGEQGRGNRGQGRGNRLQCRGNRVTCMCLVLTLGPVQSNVVESSYSASCLTNPYLTLSFSVIMCVNFLWGAGGKYNQVTDRTGSRGAQGPLGKRGGIPVQTGPQGRWGVTVYRGWFLTQSRGRQWRNLNRFILFHLL